MVAPRDSVAQRLLPGQDMAVHSSRALSAGLTGRAAPRRQHLNAGGGQLDRQRQPIQAGTDLGDGPGVGIGHREVGFDRLGALDEEGDRRILRNAQGRAGVSDRVGRRGYSELLLGPQMQRHPTGDQHLQLGQAVSSSATWRAASTTCSKLSSSSTSCFCSQGVMHEFRHWLARSSLSRASGRWWAPPSPDRCAEPGARETRHPGMRH